MPGGPGGPAIHSAPRRVDAEAGVPAAPRALVAPIPALSTAWIAFQGVHVNSAQREARNFYVWDSEPEARAFFSVALLEQVTGLHGVRPRVEFVQLPRSWITRLLMPERHRLCPPPPSPGGPVGADDDGFGERASIFLLADSTHRP